VEDCVERDVPCPELDENTGLIAVKLINDMEEVVGG
jgi:hypothetical protein